MIFEEINLQTVVEGEDSRFGDSKLRERRIFEGAVVFEPGQARSTRERGRPRANEISAGGS